MLRDSKLSRRNSGKNLNFEEIENVPVNVNLREPSIRRMSFDSSSRPPLNSLHEPLQNPSKQPGQESGFKSSKSYRTPTKAKIRHHEPAMSMRTPEKQGVLARDRFGWGHESAVNTPRTCRTPGRASLGFSELNSTHTTPTKTVTKPPNLGLTYGGNSRPPVRTPNFAALSKGIPVTTTTHTPVNTIEVPHFDLSEDPSFWMDHNVQVLIRVRPLNGMEITSQSYNRCLKQESAQCLTWIGNPETRFTFDHVACETIDQETLFKMVGQPMVENCLSGYNSCMFAYGQTGSGKTHTMLGEINNLEIKPSPYRGMTPRIFEFLFSRIIAEEGNRKNERLTYNCKCSFLEIYNEQITDLLDPSSTNLQIREDVKKGVYVENLTEFEVHTVGDILRLLSQGSANRRVASTNMNRESSRSHSVFTCVIESRWEKDSTSNLRFARLNLVDLAGSERQKSSGAEGERLKEAANINKSLSTLGNVIMVLVGANARTHVPYRDSKLTFLLQDSLGGNSKTMIIANVSPSISSATETLNTLKFAQRAKLIQNNAVINEDASGDVEALQHQIRLLKEEVASLKRLNISRSRIYNSKNGNCSISTSLDNYEDDDKVLRVSCKQLKSLETSLNGALRREQSTESCIKQLEAEIQQLNSLVHQREEENRRTNMILKFREEKIKNLESRLDGTLTVDSYLLQENKMVNEEVKLLRAKVDKNPEVTRFAVENIRLLQQLKRFQDHYEEGEREMLLSEVSELRDQLVLFLDQNDNEKEGKEDKNEDDSVQLELKKSQEELEKCMEKLNSCLEENAKLSREIADLNDLLEIHKSQLHMQDVGIEVIKEPILEASTIENKEENFTNNTKEVVDLQLEVEILKIILKEERLTRAEIEEKARDLKLTDEKLLLITKQCENLKDDLQEAKSVIEALESQNLVSINEIEDLNNSNNQYAEILREKELQITSLNDKILSQVSSSNHFEKLNKVHDSLEKAKRLNNLYQNNEEQKDQVRTQVEDETTQVIICLQEELSSFQQKLHETQQELNIMTECNKGLREKCEEKDKELYCLSEEIEGVLNCGHMALDDALNEIVVSDKLQIIARNISEKELRIHELNSCLKDAKDRGNEMESMLRSLRGATLVMSEAHQQDCNKKDEEIHQLECEIDKLKESLIEKDLIQSLKVESCCYLEKLGEMDSIINKMVTENEAMKKKEVTLMKKTESYSILEPHEHEQDCKKKDEEIHELECEIDKLKESLIEKEFAIEVESCCYLDKFQETEFIMMKELKKKEVGLIKERESYLIVEQQFETDTKEMKKQVEEIESMILEIQAIYQDLVPKASDFNDIKSQFHELLTWHEEIWCEILAKDLAVSVLHVCHMGILMETMAGLNVEKGLLYHGLCESNSLVSELKKQNGKSRKELEACSMLKGKLLVDIKNGFDRISRKEEETGKLSIKVDSFEKKILDLKDMEEAMLERFNDMGNELCRLMKEIDEKEKVINDDDVEKLVIDSCAKEIELLLKVESIKNEVEKEKIGMCMVVEKFKEDMIISFVDMQIKNRFDAEMSSCKNGEDELKKAKKRLEMEIVELESVVDENKSLIECLKEDLETVTFEKDGKLKEKEKKLKVYEKSVEELECTVNVLENQVEKMKGDAERQRLHLKQQIHSDSNMQRELDEKEKEVQDLLRRNIVLEKEITELNLKAKENNQTEMETPDVNVTSSPYNLNSQLKRSGSRSPFKCIGLGFAQKDQDLISARIRIQDLQTLLATWQNEIVKLNAQLAMSAKNSDVTTNSFIVDEDLHEKTGFHNADSQLEDLKQHLNRFLLERQRACEEFERLQAALEQNCQQKQLLKTDNEMFKTEIDNLKKDIMELEAASQKNLQQQILLHAKIKEENNVLKAQNDGINNKLKRAEAIISRVTEELANLRAKRKNKPLPIS